jgi:hypothetical protein
MIFIDDENRDSEYTMSFTGGHTLLIEILCVEDICEPRLFCDCVALDENAFG